MIKINKEDVRLGDYVWMRSKVSGISIDASRSKSGSKDIFKFEFLPTNNVYKKEDDNWIPFKGGECPVDDDTVVLVQYNSGNIDKCIGINVKKHCSNEWIDTIVAYQIITPYNPPRRKIIFENKAEMLTELISRGKLYINKEGNEHLYFSEDDIYTLGYVDEDGRSEPAEYILNCLEFWVE